MERSVWRISFGFSIVLIFWPLLVLIFSFVKCINITVHNGKPWVYCNCLASCVLYNPVQLLLQSTLRGYGTARPQFYILTTRTTQVHAVTRNRPRGVASVDVSWFLIPMGPMSSVYCVVVSTMQKTKNEENDVCGRSLPLVCGLRFNVALCRMKTVQVYSRNTWRQHAN